MPKVQGRHHCSRIAQSNSYESSHFHWCRAFVHQRRPGPRVVQRRQVGVRPAEQVVGDLVPPRPEHRQLQHEQQGRSGSPLHMRVKDVDDPYKEASTGTMLLRQQNQRGPSGATSRVHLVALKYMFPGSACVLPMQGRSGPMPRSAIEMPQGAHVVDIPPAAAPPPGRHPAARATLCAWRRTTPHRAPTAHPAAGWPAWRFLLLRGRLPPRRARQRQLTRLTWPGCLHENSNHVS